MDGAGGELRSRLAVGVAGTAAVFIVILAALAWPGGAGRPGAEGIGGPDAYGRVLTTYEERVLANSGLSYTETFAALRCDPGDQLLSGGFSGVDKGTVVIANGPDTASSAEAWLVGWENDASPDAVGVKVLCAKAAFPPHDGQGPGG